MQDSFPIAPQPQRKRRHLASSGGDEDGGPAAAAAAVAVEVNRYRPSGGALPAAGGGPAAEQFEYLDHPADVFLHSWGANFPSSLEHAGLALCNYMSDLGRFECRLRRQISVTGNSWEELVYNFLDEILFLYGSEYFFAKAIQITELCYPAAGGSCEEFQLKAELTGDIFDRALHSQGTEVKAITKHQMKIVNKHRDQGGPLPRDQAKHRETKTCENAANAEERETTGAKEGATTWGAQDDAAAQEEGAAQDDAAAQEEVAGHSDASDEEGRDGRGCAIDPLDAVEIFVLVDI